MKHPRLLPKKAGLFFLLILLLAAIQLRAQKWDEIAQLPVAMVLTSTEKVGDEIYTFGGFRPVATNSVYAFDPVTKSIGPRWAMPHAIGAAATAELNGKVYLFGGAESSSGSVTKRSYVYDPVTNAWTALRDMSIARGYATAEAVNGKIYIIGGFGHSAGIRFDLVEEYDPVLDTFIIKNNMLTPRGYLTSAVMNDRIYVIGGGVPLTFEPLGAVEVYDPAIDSWISAEDLPTPSWGMAAATLNNKIYVAGGTFDAPGNPDTTLVQVYTEEIGWETGVPLPFRMHGMSMTAFDNHLYTFGGVIDYTTFVRKILRFDPTTSGIAEANPEISFLKAYPNPASDYLTVALDSDMQDAFITVTDLNGKIMYTAPVQKTSMEMSTRDFASGIYLLRVQSGNRVGTQKVIISR